MTATTKIMSQADAPSHELLSWHATDWSAVRRNVRRLQVRIVKAEQTGKRHKVRALQRLLVRSVSARMTAVRRVTENRGKRSPGVDGEVWDTPAKKADGVRRLQASHIKSQPLKRSYVPKANGKMRPLGIPTMIDRAHQSLHQLALEPVAEVRADPNSYGFRRERSTADAISQCFIVLAKRNSPQWILEADIEACFDRLSHDWLSTHIPIHRPSLSRWLKAGYMEEGILHPTEEGSPQGGPISPVLANMALDGLEPLLRERFPSRAGRKVNFIRYADDFIVTADDPTTLREEVMPLVQVFLTKRGLRLSPEKTTITHIEDGFDFLGQNIRKYKGKFLTKPSGKSQKALLKKVRTFLKTEGRKLSAFGVLQRLNPILRGWANYHRHGASQETFQRIDHQLYQALMRWAQRRHRNKSKQWILDKYFRPPGAQRTVFQTHWTDKDGQKRTTQLYQTSRTPIRRHVKVRGPANPYDPAWELYFEQRQLNRTLGEVRQNPKIFLLLRRQRGICPVCHGLITQETGWHTHHILYQTHGGGDELDNLLLLHPNCHRQIHNPDYTGLPPRPPRGV